MALTKKAERTKAKLLQSAKKLIGERASTGFPWKI